MNETRFFYMEGFNNFMIEPLSREMRAATLKTVKFLEKKYDTCISRVDFAKLHHALEIYLASLSETKEAPLSHLVKNMEKNVNVFAEMAKMIFGRSDHTFATMLVLALDKVPAIDRETRIFVSF